MRVRVRAKMGLGLRRIVGFVILLLVSGFARAEVCGQLAGVKGDGVEVLRLQAEQSGERVRHGMRIADGKTMPLECDDVILAGRDSSAKIILANGKLSLGPESRIEIAAHAQSAGSAMAKVSLINLTYGKVRALIQKRSAVEGLSKAKEAKTGGAPPSSLPAKASRQESTQYEFRVRTFSAVAGVRGTDFFTRYDPNAGLTEQATIEGAVEVRQSGSQQKVMVTDGRQVTVEAVKGPSEEALAAEPTSPYEAKSIPPVKPLVVVAIRDSLRQEMRVASAIARDDADFANPKAIETLGRPATWTLEREPLPEKHDKLKNEF